MSKSVALLTRNGNADLHVDIDIGCQHGPVLLTFQVNAGLAGAGGDPAVLTPNVNEGGFVDTIWQH